uniref:Ig-like domain-containing protein n=1 Tax=Amphimedon queenslandica TaxID=400682 RepID=A0A1X7U890_AMPQE
MKLTVLFLIFSVLTISCYAACNGDNISPASPPTLAGFFLHKNDEYISNMSTIYRCNHCEPHCSIDCEVTPSRCGSTGFWCIRSIPKNSSMEDSMNVHGYKFDDNVSVEWIEPTPTLASPPYLSSQVNHQLCLCSSSTGATQCNSSSDEGVYRCIIKGSDVTETLQFTYSVYQLTSSSTCSGNSYVIITPSSSYQTLKAPTTALLSKETTTASKIIATRTTISSTTETTTETTTTTTVNNFSSVTSVSSSSLNSTTCPSSVKDQNSTIPHYGGIGLLATTNLLTLIVLVTSCVALGRSRANVTVQSNPIGSLSVINIETEILNEDYDSCLHKQQQQDQQQQQQQESSHPSIDIYSYAVDDEEDHSTANDNDEYATPDDLFEIKGKGSNPPPSVPPPYAGKGVAKVEETVTGVGNSSSADNLDCLYATIGSKEEEKEQAISSSFCSTCICLLTISCYAACNDFNVPPASAPASAGFF